MKKLQRVNGKDIPTYPRWQKPRAQMCEMGTTLDRAASAPGAAEPSGGGKGGGGGNIYNYLKLKNKTNQAKPRNHQKALPSRRGRSRRSPLPSRCSHPAHARCRRRRLSAAPLALQSPPARLYLAPARTLRNPRIWERRRLWPRRTWQRWRKSRCGGRRSSAEQRCPDGNARGSSLPRKRPPHVWTGRATAPRKSPECEGRTPDSGGRKHRSSCEGKHPWQRGKTPLFLEGKTALLLWGESPRPRGRETPHDPEGGKRLTTPGAGKAFLPWGESARPRGREKRSCPEGRGPASLRGGPAEPSQGVIPMSISY